MRPILFGFIFYLLLFIPLSVCEAETSVKRFVVVDSYHPEYEWSRFTHKGFCDRMLELGYFDNREQVEEFTEKNHVATSRAVFEKFWMDTKRAKSKEELAAITLSIAKKIQTLKPDLIFLGDDNAANFIGNQFLDTDIPIVFWGVNNTPVKYGLVDSPEIPGHNVTGVYQTTYYKESLELLHVLVQRVKNFAILSDNTTTGRIHTKAIAHLDRKGLLPLKLMETVTTNEFEEWKRKALELQDKVDSFFIASSNGLIDSMGKPVTNEQAAEWYLRHITIPEAAGFRYRVEAGWLCAADDSGYNQGAEVADIARDILEKGASPAEYPPRVPQRGPLLVNTKRAAMLGIELTDAMGIDEYIDTTVLDGKRKKIFVVDSYDREDPWSRETNAGFCSALFEQGYFDTYRQIAAFNRHDSVVTSSASIKRIWMNARGKKTKAEREAASLEFYNLIKNFEPDLIFLGDDTAVKFLGSKFLDSGVPVVFWGLNNTPLKYGLVDREDMPGHNITGVFQEGYQLDSMLFLKRIVPSLKTFAFLGDGSANARTHYKTLEYLERKGLLPLKLKGVINTDNYEIWKREALEYQSKVDAFFVAPYTALIDRNGKHVPSEEVTRWYTANITIPEATRGTYVYQGLFCAVFESGYNQGYEAVRIGHDILSKGSRPASYPAYSPKRGPRTVNRKRAEMLGIPLSDDMGIEFFID
ncbi:MAG: hypothetical protein KQH63_19240 [Desulfobulbaceae bacterium]|nr:hypothetical protein [Desulfobulbaceae bacterium]